jgi:hypothetical protein
MLTAPSSITSVFESYPDGVMKLEANAPGKDYCYDVGEKDKLYGQDDSFRFNSVELHLHELMPSDKVIVDFVFTDGEGRRAKIPSVDLLRLTPKIDSEGDMVYPELLLEEFNRFGLGFRNEHEEFSIEQASGSNEKMDMAYRASITNNCLAATKWEFAITSEDYSDMGERIQSDVNLNQNKILSHSWFYLDNDLYTALMKMKNPGRVIPTDLDYNALSDRSEEVVIDFDQLRRPLKYGVDVELLEIGHKTNRLIEPLDIEEHYKWEFGLILDKKDQTYASILEEPVSTTQFKDQGFYTEKDPKIFDFGWMKYVDDIQMDVIDVRGSDSYVQLKLTGEWSPYDITIGNVDLAVIDEQKLFGMLFGMNTYPKSRRYNPVQSTIFYDAELLPEDIKPFVLLTDKKTGKWINNQYKGIEKIYLTYESIEQDILNVYVLSYERITPVWMGTVKLPRDMRETVRIRKKLYNY